MPLPLALMAGVGLGGQFLSNMLMPSKGNFDTNALNNLIGQARATGTAGIRRGVGQANQNTAGILGQSGLGSSGILARMVGLNEQGGEQQLAELLAQLENLRVGTLNQQSQFNAGLKQDKAKGFGEMFGSLADIGMLGGLGGTDNSQSAGQEALGQMNWMQQLPQLLKLIFGQ